MPVNVWGVDPSSSNVSGASRQVIVATAGQTLFLLTTLVYVLGNNSLTVYINGVRQFITDAYTETSATSVTFTEGLETGDKVLFEVRG